MLPISLVHIWIIQLMHFISIVIVYTSGYDTSLSLWVHGIQLCNWIEVHKTFNDQVKFKGFMYEFWTISNPPSVVQLDRKTTHIYWLANMEYKHLKLWLSCCCFCQCQLMFLSPQVHISYYLWTSGLSKCT